MAKIVATTAVVQPASVEVSFDHYWMTNFRCQSHPNGKTTVNARLVPAKENEDGTLTTDPSNFIQVNIPDIFARVAEDPTGLIAQAFEALTLAIIAESDDFTTEA